MTRQGGSDDRIARAWVTMQRNWWSYLALHDACEKHPQKAWRILVRATVFLSTAELIEIFGAGPLEDFVRGHAPQFIRKIELHAVEHEKFRKALRIVWLPRAIDDVSARLFALGCKPLDVEIEPWQTAPRPTLKKKANTGHKMKK